MAEENVTNDRAVTVAGLKRTLTPAMAAEHVRTSPDSAAAFRSVAAEDQGLVVDRLRVEWRRYVTLAGGIVVAFAIWWLAAGASIAAPARSEALPYMVACAALGGCWTAAQAWLRSRCLRALTSTDPKESHG